MHLKIGVCLYVTLVLSGALALPASETNVSPNHGRKAKVTCPEMDPPKHMAYVTKVFTALNGDSSFSDKFYQLSEMDLRAGKIGSEVLQSISPSVQTSLNQVKKTEMERLRTQNRSPADHLDYSKPDTFGLQDLQNLSIRLAKDLADFNLNSNPKINFYLQDLDANRVWCVDEVKAFVKDSLQKAFLTSCILGVPDEYGRALLERGWSEEQRNTERALQIMDANHDGLVSLEEFQAVFLTIMNWGKSHEGVPFPMDTPTLKN